MRDAEATEGLWQVSQPDLDLMEVDQVALDLAGIQRQSPNRERPGLEKGATGDLSGGALGHLLVIFGQNK